MEGECSTSTGDLDLLSVQIVVILTVIPEK